MPVQLTFIQTDPEAIERIAFKLSHGIICQPLDRVLKVRNGYIADSSALKTDNCRDARCVVAGYR